MLDWTRQRRSDPPEQKLFFCGLLFGSLAGVERVEGDLTGRDVFIENAEVGAEQTVFGVVFSHGSIFSN